MYIKCAVVVRTSFLYIKKKQIRNAIRVIKMKKKDIVNINVVSVTLSYENIAQFVRVEN